MAEIKLKYVIGPFYHRLKDIQIWWQTREHRNNPKKVVSEVFRYVFGEDLNWDEPHDLNEKIQWLKFNSDTSMWSRLADKYAVREYVKECGLEDLLVPLYGKWDRVQDIEWDTLPCEFIMKTNHGSNDAKICRDKRTIDLAEWRYHFKLALRREYGWTNCEPHYSMIRPCIIAEKLLDVNAQSIKSSSLIDYKIWCINGIARYIWVCYDRTATSVQTMMYDREWNPKPEMCKETNHYRIATKILPPPYSRVRMLQAAEVLSKGFPQVRVDFYEVNQHPYFGEMTFTAAGGYMDFYSEKLLKELGEDVELTIAPKLI